MPVGTGIDIKEGVIYEWLAGTPRDKIAEIYNISTGGVTNIINDWRIKLGSYIAEDLRELSLSLKKAKITPIQCSMGFRVAKIMQRLGITEDQFESFMSEIYSRCQKLEVGPDQIERYLTETINLSKVVFPSQIPNYINTKKMEMAKLQEQKEILERELSELSIRKSIAEREVNKFVVESNISREAITWYKNSKQEFENAKISINDISFFIQCVDVIKSESYDVGEILRKFIQYKNIDDLNDFQQTTIDINKKNLDRLINQEKYLREQINLHQLKLFKMHQLESMGFGLQEFKILYDKINEIGNEYDINYVTSIEKFLNDLEDYDNFLGFKIKVEKLQQEFYNLESQISKQRSIILSQQYVGSTLQKLLKMGISEKDIENINSIISLGEFEYYDNDNNKIAINKELLLAELVKYRNIKLLIQSLGQKQIHLTNNIKEFETRKIILENYINYLFILLSNLKNLQILLNKVNIALESPKLLLVLLCFISVSKDDEKYFKKDNDSPN